MAEIISVTTTARYLFGPDVIPWAQMLAPSSRAKLQTRYKFTDVRHVIPDPSGNPVQLLFLRGEFLRKGIPHTVEQLVFEPSVIQFQVAANSDEAGAFLDDLSTALEELRPGERFSWTLAQTRAYQTAAVAHLGVSHAALISKELQRFISEAAAPIVALPDAKAEIALERLGWRVSYLTQSADFLYLPKVLTIEPRAGSKPSENLYFTQSPSEYKKHVKLLTAFERMLGTGKMSRKAQRKGIAK